MRGWGVRVLVLVGAVAAGFGVTRRQRLPRSAPLPASLPEQHRPPTQPRPDPFADAPIPSGNDWRPLLQKQGLSRYVSALEKLVRPAVRITTTRVDLDRLALGQSRLGGAPDLPADFKWPKYEGKHLSFVAQINLKEVAAAAREDALPAEGQLWFFYVVEQDKWGFDPKDAGSAVVAFRSGGKLARRPIPDDVGDQGRFEPTALAFAGYVDLPDQLTTGSPVLEDDDEGERYSEVEEFLSAARGTTSHKLLGHAQPIQDAMEEECAQVAGGLYLGGDRPIPKARAQELAKKASEWHLLLQVDTDDNANMMWGDTGRLYFWIRDEDLRQRRFDKTWLILQCG
jgi:uncharacterized protein YwqG